MKYLFYFLLLTASTAIAQEKNPGFLGKKNIIEASGIGHFRLINNIANSSNHYMRDGNKLVNKKRWFEYGGQIGLNRAINKKVMLGIQASVYKQYAAPQGIYFYDPFYGTSTNVTHEMIDIRSITIAPRIEFAPDKGVFPIGFSHCLSIGYTKNKIAEKDYLVRYNEYNGSGNAYAYSTVKYTEDAYQEISLGYSLKTRIPLSKRLIFLYAFNYNLNIPIGSQVTPLEIIFDGLDDGGINSSVYRSRLFTIFTMNAGLSLAF